MCCCDSVYPNLYSDGRELAGPKFGPRSAADWIDDDRAILGVESRHAEFLAADDADLAQLEALGVVHAERVLVSSRGAHVLVLNLRHAPS